MKQEHDRVVENAGGFRPYILQFQLRGDHCSLDYSRDIQPIFEEDGWCSTGLMDWFRLCFSGQVPSGDFQFCSPFLFTALMNHTNHRKETYDRIETVVKKFRLSAARHTVIVPVSDASHWSLAVMTGDDLFHFDSMHHDDIHGWTLFYRLFGKLWCVRSGFDQHSSQWKRATDRRKWRVVRVPQQRGNWECAYFTMQYAMTYVEDVLKLGFSVDEVRDL